MTSVLFSATHHPSAGENNPQLMPPVQMEKYCEKLCVRPVPFVLTLMSHKGRCYMEIKSRVEKERSGSAGDGGLSRKTTAEALTAKHVWE